jgi:pimeloyl-ACP methyl ester carboxylesterase
MAALALASFFIVAAHAEVVSVPLPGGSEPTRTFLWEAQAGMRVLIMIPGGEGQLGLTPDKTNVGGFYAAVLRPLADPAMTSGTTHVVLVDSPYSLPVGTIYPVSRAAADHLGRIERVIRFYKARFGAPVWLMGHSNGAVSVAEFIRRKPDLVGGAIFSSSRSGLTVAPSVPFPVLFLHHQLDGCAGSDARNDQRQFERLRSAGKTNAAFVWLRGGTAEQKSPCASGYHMYFGAEAEAFQAIDAFLTTYD